MGLSPANARFQEDMRRQREAADKGRAEGDPPSGTVTDGIQDSGAPLVRDPNKGDPKVEGKSEGKSGGGSDSTMLLVGFGSSLCCVVLSIVGVVMMSKMRAQ